MRSRIAAQGATMRRVCFPTASARMSSFAAQMLGKHTLELQWSSRIRHYQKLARDHCTDSTYIYKKIWIWRFSRFRGPMPLDSRATSADRAHFRWSFTAILPCCSAAWPAPLPLSTFTAFLGLYCLCLILLSVSAMLTLPTGCHNLLILSTILLYNLACGFLQTLSLYRDRSTLVCIIYIYGHIIYVHIYIYIYMCVWPFPKPRAFPGRPAVFLDPRCWMFVWSLS